MNYLLAAASLLLPSTAQASDWSLGGGYIGETLTHPGVMGTIEHHRGSRDAPGLLLLADLGVYWHPRANITPFGDIRVGRRIQVQGRYSIDLSAGFGYMHPFIAAETANFANNGRPAAMPLVELGLFGWQLSSEPDSLRLLAAVRVFGQTPVNGHLVVHPALIVSITRSLEAKP